MVDFIKQLTSLRNQSSALQSGSAQWLYAEGDVIAFARCLDGEWVIWAINRGLTPEALSIPIWEMGLEQGCFSLLIKKGEGIDASDGTLELTIPAKSGEILVQA